MAQSPLLLEEQFRLPEGERQAALAALLAQYWQTWLQEAPAVEDEA